MSLQLVVVIRMGRRWEINFCQCFPLESWIYTCSATVTGTPVVVPAKVKEGVSPSVKLPGTLTACTLGCGPQRSQEKCWLEKNSPILFTLEDRYNLSGELSRSVVYWTPRCTEKWFMTSPSFPHLSPHSPPHPTSTDTRHNVMNAL